MVAIAETQSDADQIVRRFRPQKIILFGSYAQDAETADSEVDLLEVMPDGGDPIGKAAEIRSAINRDFPLDLIVRDSQTLQKRAANND